MALNLRFHPDGAGASVTGIAVEAERSGPGRLALRYLVAGGSGLVVPPPAPPERTDGLWRHTCFEAFLRAPGEAAYCEFNLSPSGQWAAYRFTGYREGMAPLEPLPTPAVAWRAAADGFELSCVLDLAEVPDLAGAPWRLALSAVIEAAAGRSSYWALAHPPGRADFHHLDGFALDLPIP